MSDARPSTSSLVVDTGVFGSGLVPSSADLARRYLPHLVGRRVVIAYKTVAELRYAAIRRGWGDATLQEMERRLGGATVATVDDGLARVYARLKADCTQAGHPLGQKVHDGDRWIAATAIRYRIPLVSHDGIFVAAPGLDLVTELERA